MYKKAIKFFDKLEDKVRNRLSHRPTLYAFLGGIGVVLFWRGIWHGADDLNLDPILSLVIGFIILLITGAFVSTFIGSRLIVSGLDLERKHEKETEKEIESEEAQIKKLQNTLNRVEEKINTLESEINHK